MTTTSHHSPNGQPRKRRDWAPNGDDHLIFDFVRMKGKTQECVAMELGISQSTVSRVLQRYERWQAHAKDREGGRLDPGERLRAQRWLAAERNELMLASCLRIANRMEGLHYSTSMTREHGPGAAGETIRTHQQEVDCSGVAARFYRLALRLNQELLKLAEKDQPPPPPPLSAEELQELEEQAAETTEELRRAHEKTIRDFDEANRQNIEAQREIDRLKQVEEAERAALAAEILQQQESAVGRQEADAASAELNNVHNLHKENGAESATTSDSAIPCDQTGGETKNDDSDCIGRSLPGAAGNGKPSAPPVHSLRTSVRSSGRRQSAARRLTPK